MKYNGDAKIIKAKIPDPEPENKGSDLFTDEPVKTPWEKEAEKNAPAPDENAVDYEPAPETDMDFMTEEEEKEHRKSVIIGAIIGLLIAGLLIGGYIYHNQTGKIRGANVSTTVTTEKASQKYGSLEPTQNTTRTYKTQQLTVHKDENGVWRSYAGLDKTVRHRLERLRPVARRERKGQHEVLRQLCLQRPHVPHPGRHGHRQRAADE